MHIPAFATAVHGISDEDKRRSHSLKKLHQNYGNDFRSRLRRDLILTGFDVPLLAEEMLRAGVDFDLVNETRTLAIFHKMEPRNLSAAYQFYCNKTLEDAHSAEADTSRYF